jgi:hypothetical protein
MFVNRALSKLNHFSYVLTTQHRNVRGVRKIFRQTLPKYKNNLMNLRSWQEMPNGDEVSSLEGLWRNRTDYYKLYMPANQGHILLEALFNPNNDIDQLLRIIDENLPTMNSFYLATSFEALNDMMQMGQCDIDTVLVSPELKNLCERSLLKLRFFDADEVLKLIKCLSTMSVPEDTLIVQSALQIARHLINDFNPDELAELRQSLDQFRVTDESRKSLLIAMKQATTIKLNQLPPPHQNLLGSCPGRRQ